MSRLSTYLPLFSVAAIAALLALWPNAAPALRYERAAILNGEWWRIISGQLLHLGWRHLAYNVAVLLLLALYFDVVLRGWRGLILLAAGLMGTGLGLLLFSPQVEWYVGLSGAIYGLLLGTCWLYRPYAPRISLLVIALLVAKIAWESLFGPLPGAQQAIGGPIISQAHLYGGATGWLAALVISVRTPR